MIYFLLSIFGLFFNVSSVNAYSDYSDLGYQFYVNGFDDRYNTSCVKKFIDEHRIFENNQYNLDDFNSYMFYRFATSCNDVSSVPDYYIANVAFADDILVYGVSESNFNYLNFSFSNAYSYHYSFGLEKFYFSRYADSDNSGDFDFGNFIPVFTHNVYSNLDLYVKFSSKLCSDLGHFCDNASEPDQYGQIYVQYAWKGGKMLGIYNLVVGEDISEIKNANYTVNIYLDDKLHSTYTENGIVGNSVTLKGLDDDTLKSDSNNKYDVVLSDDNNVFELRYYTNTYGTVNQQINTDNSELYLPFSYDKLKSMFPGINFDLWTSYEQFNFTLLFNIFFILFLIFIGYILLRIFYFIRGWFL